MLRRDWSASRPGASAARWGREAPPTQDAAPAADAVEHAYTQHVLPIYRFLYSRLGNQEEAEDLTSEVFLKAVRQLEPAREPASVQAWLFQVARTTLADYWRRRSRLPADPLGFLDIAEGNAADEPSTEGGAAGFARWLLDRLPPRDREVLTLRFLHGYSIKETAATLGITVNHAKVLQHRAVQRAAALGQQYREPTD